MKVTKWINAEAFKIKSYLFAWMLYDQNVPTWRQTMGILTYTWYSVQRRDFVRFLYCQPVYVILNSLVKFLITFYNLFES